MEEIDRFELVSAPGAPEDHNGNGYVCAGLQLPKLNIHKMKMRLVVDDIDR